MENDSRKRQLTSRGLLKKEKGKIKEAAKGEMDL